MRSARQSGFALAMVLVFLLVMSVTMFIASGLTMTDMRVVTNIKDEKNAVTIAEAGVHEALKRLSLTTPNQTVTIDGSYTFNPALGEADRSGVTATFFPDDNHLDWNAKILFNDSQTTQYDTSTHTLTTRTIQAADGRLPYSTTDSRTADNGTLTMQWSCWDTRAGATYHHSLDCTDANAEIRKLFKLPVLDIISTGTFGNASRKITASVVPAVPGLGAYKDGCPPMGVDMQGTVNVTVTGTVQINSTCTGSPGYAINGNGGTLVQTAGQMNVAGTVASGHASSPDMNTGAPRQDDPLGPTRANLRPPCYATSPNSPISDCRVLDTAGEYPAPVVRNYQNNAANGDNLPDTCTGTAAAPKVCDLDGGASGVTIYPGIYYGGLRFKKTVTMSPGIYIIAGGGLHIKSGTTTITGTGVMFFNGQSDDVASRSSGSCPTSTDNTNDSTGQLCAFDTSGSATITWVSPASGYYRGVVLYQERNSDGIATAQPTLYLQGGNGTNSLVDGLVYAVDATLDFQGGINVAGNIIVGNMTAHGSVDITGSPSNTALIAEHAGFTQVVAWKDI